MKKNIVITSDKSAVGVLPIAQAIAKVFNLHLFSAPLITKILAMEHYSNLPAFSLIKEYLKTKDLDALKKLYGMPNDYDYTIFYNNIFSNDTKGDIFIDSYALKAFLDRGWVLDTKFLPYALSPKMNNIISILTNQDNGMSFVREEINETIKNTYVIQVYADEGTRLERMLNRIYFSDPKSKKTLTEKKLTTLLRDQDKTFYAKMKKHYDIKIGEDDKYIDFTYDSSGKMYHEAFEDLTNHILKEFFKCDAKQQKTFQKQIKREKNNLLYASRLSDRISLSDLR